ncbi:MAG: 2-C-methyl-D-erythritol 4-phosphate cytidylyltransferase [Candidatus Neomarinimicrobiota bacterium]
MTPDTEHTVAAIIPAAGEGTRLTAQDGTGDAPRKQFRQLGGKPLVVRTLERVLAARPLAAAVVVVPADDLASAQEMLKDSASAEVALSVVPGGASRQASVAAGLAALPSGVDVVVVHDAVRPLFEPGWIGAIVDLCREFDGAIVAIRATDTLKETRAVTTGPAKPAGVISRTIPRADIWQAQTPQAFKTDLLREALRRAGETGSLGTDEASLVEALGGMVAIVEGSPVNIKVTSPADWAYAEWQLARAEGAGQDG